MMVDGTKKVATTTTRKFVLNRAQVLEILCTALNMDFAQVEFKAQGLNTIELVETIHETSDLEETAWI